jgi:predicted  nucleic acid-binding Zn-ribbon protein
MATEKTMAVNVALGEVRKATRFLAALDRVDEALDVLAQEDKIRNDIKASTEEYQRINATLSAKNKELSDSFKSLEDGLKEKNAAFNKRVLEISAKEAELLNETNLKLQVQKDAAFAVNERARMELNDLRNEIAQLKGEKYNVEEGIKTIRDNASKDMADMLAVFKKVSG